MRLAQVVFTLTQFANVDRVVFLIDGVATYAAPVPEFSLQRIELDGSVTLEPGPAIVLCTRGHAIAGDHVLDRGAAAWIPATDGSVSLEGAGTVFRAGVGQFD